jgi:tartrate dehydratase alpha subunit/fumarate hydratase class I-like protein
MHHKGFHNKIQHNNVRIVTGMLAVFLVSAIVILLSSYLTSMVAAQNTKDALITNTNTNNTTSAALPTSTAVQKNATAESIAKGTGTNSSGITGFNSSSPMKSMINPVFKMTRNPLANMTNPLNSTGK